MIRAVFDEDLSCSRALAFVILLSLLLGRGDAQVVQSLTGKLHVSCDNRSVLYINGKEGLQAVYKRNQKVTDSDEMTLNVGDHLVFQLHNAGGPKGLLVQFVSSNGKMMMHFPSNAYRLLPNPTATNFTDAEFREGHAVRQTKHPDGDKVLPVKSKSERIWGETATCAVAVTITREMIGPVTQ